MYTVAKIAVTPAAGLYNKSYRRSTLQLWPRPSPDLSLGPLSKRHLVSRKAKDGKVRRHAVPPCAALPPADRHRVEGPAPQTAALSRVETFDYVVIGSGIAGLTYALKVAEHGAVAVITKDDAQEGCTQYAQGGVSAVLDANDSVENHIRDTMVAGGFLNSAESVEVVCTEGPAAVLELIKLGAEFTRNVDGSLHLTREGGHSNCRVVHAADVTGREIERALVESARAHPNIHLFEHHLATALVVDEVAGIAHCLGVDVLDQVAERMMRFVAPVAMLATGGAGQVYPTTTNPGVATGDGMAMAYRANAAMANMEFVQFHPTAFYAGATPAGIGREGRSFLISEAVRGEGGVLYNTAGERFMPRYDMRHELAPRDVVARAIQDQMLLRGDSHVLLDISHEPAGKILSHFPNIAARCRSHGIDITRKPIPVVPAQHYMCGGVQTGMQGETSIAGLYACGEVACTGLHGANRLASNSLLEALVFANRAAAASVAYGASAQARAASVLRHAATHADFSGSSAFRPLPPAAAVWVANKRRELREIMWQAAGIVRRGVDMRAALLKLAEMYVEAKSLAAESGVSTPIVELRNLITVGELIMASAAQRKESRGLHYCVDFPSLVDEQCRATVIDTSLRRRHGLSKRVTPLPHMAQLLPGRSPALDKMSPRARELSMRSTGEDSV